MWVQVPSSAPSKTPEIKRISGVFRGFCFLTALLTCITPGIKLIPGVLSDIGPFPRPRCGKYGPAARRAVLQSCLWDKRRRTIGGAESRRGWPRPKSLWQIGKNPLKRRERMNHEEAMALIECLTPEEQRQLIELIRALRRNPSPAEPPAE